MSEVIRQQSMQPPEQAKALLFDCDGTLVDTISLYRSCWHQVFGRNGFEVADIWFDTWAGHSVRPFVSAALPDADEEKISQVADEGVNLFLSSTHLLKPLGPVTHHPHLTDTFIKLKGKSCALKIKFCLSPAVPAASVAQLPRGW